MDNTNLADAIIGGVMRTESNTYEIVVKQWDSFMNLTVSVEDDDGLASMELFTGEFTYQNFCSAMGRVLGHELLSKKGSLFMAFIDIEATSPFPDHSDIFPTRHGKI